MAVPGGDSAAGQGYTAPTKTTTTKTATKTGGGGGGGGGGRGASGTGQFSYTDASGKVWKFSDMTKYLQAAYPELIPMFKVPELHNVLAQAIKGGWDTTRIRGAIEGTKWFQTHNRTQQQWLIATPAEQEVLKQDALTKYDDAYMQMFGEHAPKDDRTITGLASGQFSIDQWTRQERQTNAYKQRYPGLAAREAAGLPHIDETQYRALEEGYRQQLSQHGLPHAYFDQPQDFTQLFSKDIDPTEFGKRLDAYKAISGIYSPYMRQAFEQHAGIKNLSDSDMYGVLTGQRPDLVAAYTKATGTPPPSMSIYDIGKAQQQAIGQEEAEFSSGGAIKGATSGQEQKTTQDLATAI